MGDHAEQGNVGSDARAALDLNNYKDTLHYGQWINDAMAECIAGGEYAVSSRETLDAATEKLRAWANAQIEAGGWIF